MSALRWTWILLVTASAAANQGAAGKGDNPTRPETSITADIGEPTAGETVEDSLEMFVSADELELQPTVIASGVRGTDARDRLLSLLFFDDRKLQQATSVATAAGEKRPGN